MASTLNHLRHHCGSSASVAVGEATPCAGSNPSLVPDEGADFIDQTVAVWQGRSKRLLTREDGREIIENMTGFFRIVQEWDRADRKAGTVKK